MNYESLTFIFNNLSKKGRFLLFFVIFLSVFSSLVVIIVPVLLSSITTQLTEHIIPSVSGVYMVGIAYVILISLQKIVGFFSTYCQSILRILSISSISKFYLKKIYDSSTSVRGKQNSGEMSQTLNQASNDIYILVNAAANSLFPPLIQLTVAIVFITVSGDYIVALAFGIFAFLYAGLSFYYSKRLAKSRSTLMESGRNTYGLLVDSVQNVPVIRAFNTFDYFFFRFNAALISDLKSQRLYWNLNFLNLSLGGLLQLFFFGSSFFYTLNNVINGTSTLGHFILISSYLLVISAPLEHLGQAYIDFVQSGSSLKQFIARNSGNECSEPTGSMTLTSGITSVSVQGLTHQYTDSGFVLGPLDITSQKGTFTSITGFNGSGKSTLIKIMTRQIIADSGHYYLSDIDAFKITTDAFCQKVAYVSQDDFIFRDSIEFNLRIANPSATHEEMLAALRKASLSFSEKDEVENLDKKLQDSGLNLSGGQRQKLSLARLFLRKPDLIFLDEITSSLDLHAEKNLFREVRETFPEGTIINISHRPAGFALSDSIVIMEQGKVIEHTSPENCQYLRNVIPTD